MRWCPSCSWRRLHRLCARPPAAGVLLERPTLLFVYRRARLGGASAARAPPPLRSPGLLARFVFACAALSCAPSGRACVKQQQRKAGLAGRAGPRPPVWCGAVARRRSASFFMFALGARGLAQTSSRAHSKRAGPLSTHASNTWRTHSTHSIPAFELRGRAKAEREWRERARIWASRTRLVCGGEHPCAPPNKRSDASTLRQAARVWPARR